MRTSASLAASVTAIPLAFLAACGDADASGERFTGAMPLDDVRTLLDRASP